MPNAGKRLNSFGRAGLLLGATAVMGITSAAAKETPPCPKCAEWNVSQQPFQVYGNTYYVGVHGLSSILITSAEGHVLIDGDLAESVPKIAASVRKLGFRVEDIKFILNSHVHYDHAGGIAGLARLSGAQVAASKPAAQVLEAGHSGPNDPQFGILPDIGPVASVKVIQDGETLHVGSLAVTAHFTPGHTPGGTSWTWQSCEQQRCLNMVYADSLSAVSADNFRFTDSRTYPSAQADFAKSFATLRNLPCDILLTPHPSQSDMWERLEQRAKGDANAFVDTTACKHYVDDARDGLNKRLTQEAAAAHTAAGAAH